ncbi:MAG: hypothetical protein ACLPXZ_14850, partial [Mycobacterium sp.]
MSQLLGKRFGNRELASQQSYGSVCSLPGPVCNVLQLSELGIIDHPSKESDLAAPRRWICQPVVHVAFESG